MYKTFTYNTFSEENILVQFAMYKITSTNKVVLNVGITENILREHIC